MRIISDTKLQLGPDRNSGSSPVPVEFGLAPVPVDLAGTAIFFMLYYRFYDELPASCAPPVPWLDHVHLSSSHFPDYITFYPPVPSQTASRALLQFPGCITCSPPVPRMYHVLPSSSQNVSCRPPPLATRRHLERKIIFIFTVCYFNWFHIKHRHFSIIILLGRYQTVTAIFSCWIIGFTCLTPISYLHHVPPLVSRLDHVHPSSSQTVLHTTIQFPDYITCSPPVPWLYHVPPPVHKLYHVLPSGSQNFSRAPHVPFGDTWKGKLSLFSSFAILFIDFTLRGGGGGRRGSPWLFCETWFRDSS